MQKLNIITSSFPIRGDYLLIPLPQYKNRIKHAGVPFERMDDTAFILLMDNRFLSYKEYLSDWIKKIFSVLPPDPDLLREEIQKFYPST